MNSIRDGNGGGDDAIHYHDNYSDFGYFGLGYPKKDYKVDNHILDRISHQSNKCKFFGHFCTEIGQIRLIVGDRKRGHICSFCFSIRTRANSCVQ